VRITRIDLEPYGDYVYDVSVPGAEMFWGGTTPVLLHNSDERGIDVIRGKIKDFARTLPLASVPWKIIFLDEADALTHDAQHALRRTMERFSATTRFALSCNYSSKIIEPIQSRCAVFRFSPLAEKEVRTIIERVVRGEGLKLDKAGEDAVLYVSEGDARKAVNVLQGAAALGEKISAEDVYRVSSRARPAEVEEMVRLAWDGKFVESRKKLDQLLIAYGMSGEDVITQMFREISGLGVPDEAKVQLVDKVGEYNFRLVEGADERLQLEALLAQVMLLGSRHRAPPKVSE
jgi:replication factor C small subunit